MPDFVEIMVFRRHPENRNRVDALLRQVLCHAGGSNCFVNSVGRSAETAGLLTRDDSDCAIFEAIEVGAGFGAGAEQFILLAKNSRDIAAAISWKIESSGDAKNTFEIRLVLEKGAYAFVGIYIITQQLRLVGERFDREGTTMHGCLMIAGRFGDTQIDA